MMLTVQIIIKLKHHELKTLSKVNKV